MSASPASARSNSGSPPPRPAAPPRWPRRLQHSVPTSSRRCRYGAHGPPASPAPAPAGWSRPATRRETTCVPDVPSPNSSVERRRCERRCGGWIGDGTWRFPGKDNAGALEATVIGLAWRRRRAARPNRSPVPSAPQRGSATVQCRPPPLHGTQISMLACGRCAHVRTFSKTITFEETGASTENPCHSSMC
jgi:hypothetical protein